MGTKNNPGAFDCYAAADPDEPMFVLLGRDPIAAFLVGWWVGLKLKHDSNADEVKLREALECAQAMDAWLLKMNQEEKIALRKAIMEEGLRLVAAIEQDEKTQEDSK